MFIIDDILLSPMKGFLWIVEELRNAAEAEQEHEADNLTAKLSTLYMMLETGQMSAEEFDAQEAAILSRLDQLKGTTDEGDPATGDSSADEEDEEDDDDQGEGEEADEADPEASGADADDRNVSDAATQREALRQHDAEDQDHPS